MAKVLSFEEKYSHERGFSSYFTDHLSPILRDLESVRVQRLFIYISLVVILLGILGFYAHAEILKKGLNAEIVLSVMGLMLFAYFPSGLIKYYFEKKSKSIIMPEIMAFFSGAKYTADGHINVSDIKNFFIVPSYTHVEGSDLIQYSEKFTLSHLRLKYRRGTSGKAEVNVTFDGVCILMDLTKGVLDPIAIKIDEGMVVNWLSNLGKGYERINLGEHPFEKIFDVYCNNKNEARSVLTVELMELFLKLNFLFANFITTPSEMETQVKKVLSGWNGERGNQEASLMANFMGNKLLLLIPTSEAMFKPASLFKSCTDTASIRTILYQLKILENVHDAMVANLK